jgi:malonyl-CoA O-methyltransferase
MDKTKRVPIPIDVQQGYALWAKSYAAEAHNPLMQIEEAALKSLVPEVSGKVCLDLACGSGRYLKWMRQNKARLALGCDASIEMLRMADVDGLVQSAFFPLPFADQAFDLIICGLAVGHSPDLMKVIAEASRVLRPSGTLIYSDFHPFASTLGWRRTFNASDGAQYALEHYTHFYQDHVAACNSAGLTIQAIKEPLAGEHGPAEYAHVPVVLVVKATKDGQ